jgi:hypothetical protein
MGFSDIIFGAFPSSKEGSTMRSDEITVLERFVALAEEWKKDTKRVSGTESFFNEHYRKIIEMGDQVVPILLDQLLKGLAGDEVSGDWFWALKLIAEENPVPEKLRGDARESAEVWIEWGKKNGYIKKEKDA